MRKRKSPIRHRVSSHKRKRKTVSSYMRGNGPPVVKIRKTRINRNGDWKQKEQQKYDVDISKFHPNFLKRAYPRVCKYCGKRFPASIPNQRVCGECFIGSAQKFFETHPPKNHNPTFDYKELTMGIKVEMEHTTNPKIAEKIARDHLREFPDYYTRLLKMEEEAKKSLRHEKLRRTLTTVESRGTQIIHNKAGTEGKIVGTVIGGFKVYVPKEGRELKLPFQNVKNWSVVTKPKQEVKLKVPQGTKVTVTEKEKNPTDIEITPLRSPRTGAPLEPAGGVMYDPYGGEFHAVKGVNETATGGVLEAQRIGLATAKNYVSQATKAAEEGGLTGLEKANRLLDQAQRVEPWHAYPEAGLHRHPVYGELKTGSTYVANMVDSARQSKGEEKEEYIRRGLARVKALGQAVGG